MREEQSLNLDGFILIDNQLTESTYYNEKTHYYSGFALSITVLRATRPSVHSVHV